MKFNQIQESTEIIRPVSWFFDQRQPTGLIFAI